MDGYQEKTSSVSVPKNTGIDGFLKTLRTILLLPRVQTISIDAKGKVSYMRYVREGEPDTAIDVDYTGLEPWSVIRNGHLDEIALNGDEPAPSVLAAMFNKVACEGLVPVAFATGADTAFWSWHKRTSGVDLAKTATVYGLPLYTDRQLPDYSLVICASYIRGSLVDCHRFIKATMGTEFAAPSTSVSIL